MEKEDSIKDSKTCSLSEIYNIVKNIQTKSEKSRDTLTLVSELA